MTASCRERASQWGALFVCVWLLAAAPAQAQDCPAAHIDERAAVAEVIDGDTLRLRDGRSVRFIGINAPEIGHDGAPSEPHAQQARRAVAALLGADASVALRYGRERRDRYGRLLAHVYTADGASLAARLLSTGLAAQIVVPPNTRHLACYQAAEREARDAGRGVWADIYRPVPVAELPRAARGFRIISGRVVRVGESRRSLWLNFAGRRVALRIARDDLGYFQRWDPRELAGRRIEARGWLTPGKGQSVMRLRHPAALDLK